MHSAIQSVLRNTDFVGSKHARMGEDVMHFFISSNS